MPDRQQGELVVAEHVVRYRFAAQLAPGRRVLDAASGEGYGSAILAAAGAASVRGVELDPKAVAHAQERYGLEFTTGNVEQLPLDDASFDLVVSFETIEHVNDPERTLAEFRRVLAPDGLLVISTPNKDRSLVENEFHAREFTHDEFVALLRQTFPHIALRYQQNWMTTAILGEREFGEDKGERPIAADLYKLLAARPGDELYTVAVCAAVEPSLAEARGVAALTTIDEAHALATRAVTAERLVAVWYERATTAEGQVSDWVARATEAERQVGEWTARAAEAERQIEQMSASLAWKVHETARKIMRRLGGPCGDGR